MQIHRLVAKITAACLICVGDDDGILCHQPDALPQDIFGGDVVRIGVIGVEREGRACQLVHNIAAGSAHNHIFGKVIWKGACLTDHFCKAVELCTGRQAAGQQQIAHLFKSKAILALKGIQKVIDVDAAIGQMSFDRFAFAFVD